MSTTHVSSLAQENSTALHGIINMERKSTPMSNAASSSLESKIKQALLASAHANFAIPFPLDCEPRWINTQSIGAIMIRSDASNIVNARMPGVCRSNDANLSSDGSPKNYDDFFSGVADEEDDDVSMGMDEDALSIDVDEEDDGSSKRERCRSKWWGERFRELKTFQKKHGHCKVTPRTEEVKGLIQWIKRQRYQFRLKELGKPSPITDDQIRQLEEIGFVWNTHGKAWDTKVRQLDEFRRRHGHCRVPRDYPQNQPLSTWVKRQRRLYKSGKVPPLRVVCLENMCFVWDPRNLHHKSATRSSKMRA